jgi:hypothetical protein
VAWSRQPGDRFFRLSLSAWRGWLDDIEIIPYDDDSWPYVFPPPGYFEPPVVANRG